MADDGENERKYTIITENSEVKHTSRGYTGKATAKYENGDVYDGDFVNGIREGSGRYSYGKNNDVYVGDWVNNDKHGIGKMIYNMDEPPAEGEEDKPVEPKIGEYQGYWENGRRHGEGVFTYPNGDIYSGWWKFGKKEGTGTYVSKETGMRMQGIWANSEMSTGRWIYPNGVFYEGSFKNNKPSGEGTWHFDNGNTLKGVYTQKQKGNPEEEEEESAPKEYESVFQADTGISKSAYLVNSVEQ